MKLQEAGRCKGRERVGRVEWGLRGNQWATYKRGDGIAKKIGAERVREGVEGSKRPQICMIDFELKISILQ